jgi:hypothetical protein
MNGAVGHRIGNSFAAISAAVPFGQKESGKYKAAATANPVAAKDRVILESRLGTM